MEDSELQTKIDQIYKVIKKLVDKYSKKKIKWLYEICGREFGLIESLIENFLSNIDQVKYATKILMILQKCHEYIPDVVQDQYLENKLFPKAISEYIKLTKLEDMTPDAFLLLKEIFQESTFEEVLEDREFVNSLMEALGIINKASYFDAVCDILLVRFQKYSGDPQEPLNEETEYFLNLLAEHRTGRLFIETTIHLLNRRGSEAKRTMNCLTHILLNEKLFAMLLKNDKILLIDIIEDELDKDMENDDREDMINVLYQLLRVSSEDYFYKNKLETIRRIWKTLNDDPETLTEKANELIEGIIALADKCEAEADESDDENED